MVNIEKEFKKQQRKDLVSTEKIEAKNNDKIYYEFKTEKIGKNNYKMIASAYNKESGKRKAERIGRELFTKQYKSEAEMIKDKKQITQQKNPHIQYKEKSLSFIGLSVGDNPNLWITRDTRLVPKKNKVIVVGKEQVFVRAEAYFFKKDVKKYAGEFYGYSKFGGTEKEAVEHIYGQVRTKFDLGSEKIELDVLQKGIIKYDR